MKYLLILSLLFCLGRADETGEVLKYHEILLTKPDNVVIYERFVNAWLEEESREKLQKWLQEKARKGGAGDWQILSRFHAEMGEAGLALLALDEAVKRDGENAGVRFSRARLRAKGDDLEGALEDIEAVIVDEKRGREGSRLKGVWLARLGRIAEAKKTWQDLLKRFPNDEDLREDLIEMQIEEGLWTEAIETSLGLIEATKDPYKKALRQLRVAEIYGLAEDRDAQLASYEKVLKVSGAGTWLEREVLSQIEQIHLRESDVQGLRDYYQKLRETYPQRTSIRKALARQMARNGELEEASALFREVLKMTPGDLGNREEFIAFLENNEQWEEALLELRELIRQKENDPLLWEHVLVIEANMKNRAGMLLALEKLRDQKSATAEGVIAVSARYRQHDFVKETEALLRNARVCFPESAEVARTLGDFLAGQDQAEEALELWLAAADGGREETLSVVRSMAGHKMTDRAFELLSRKVLENPDDRILITQLGRYALTEEQASQAIPHLLDVVKSSTSSTEMSDAIVLAASVVLRSGKDADVIAELEKSAPSPPLKCLLAELEASAGDLIKAGQILDEAGDDLRVKFFRVQFAEKNRDLATAIRLLEEVLEDPRIRKTIHLRRLVSLYERAGKIPAALQRVDQWKRTSPGNRQAWLAKARLLSEAGRLEEAISEYRRTLGKFGEEEDRIKLAEALEKGGLLFEAGAQYRKLYETATERDARLTWVSQWGKMMARIDQKEEVVKVLQKRSQTNRRSAESLIALAELYQDWKEPEKRRGALLEAVRRQPKDWQILHDLADEAEGEGDIEDAITLLKEAARVEKGDLSKAALAEFFIRHDEVEKGVKILQSTPGLMKDPRKIEVAVESLALVNQLEIATNFLKEALRQHPEDWRLEYLYALLRLQAGEEKEAIVLFHRLDRVVQPLVNVSMPAQKMRHGRQRSYFAGFPPESERLMTLGNSLVKQGFLSMIDPFASQSHSMPSRRNPQTPLYNLPHSPDSLRDLAFLRYSSSLGLRKENDRKEFHDLVKISTRPRKIFLLSKYDRSGYLDFVREELADDPTNVELCKMWLVLHPSDREGNSEITAKAFEVLRKEVPLEIFQNLALMYGAYPSQDEIWFAVVEEIYRGLSPAEQLTTHDCLAGIIGQSSHNRQDNSVRPPGDENFKKFVWEELLKRKTPLPLPQIYSRELDSLLHRGKGTEAVVLLNHLIEKGTPARANPGTGRNRGMRVESPRLPELRIRPWLDLARLKREHAKFQMSGVDRENQLALLRELSGAEDVDQKIPHDPLTVLGKHVDEITHPFYRALVLLALEEHEKLPGLVAKMAAGNDPEQLYFAASFYAGTGAHLVAYQCLLKCLDLNNPGTFKEIAEANLVGLFRLLSEEEKAMIDLKRPQDILVRMSSRKIIRLSPQLLREVDLPAQAERLERIEKSRKLQRTKARQKQARPPARPRGRDLIETELAAGSPEKAITEMQRLIRKNWSIQSRLGKVKEEIALFSEDDHADLLLTALRPATRATADHWRIFLAAARVLNRETSTRAALEELLKIAPDDHQARVDLFLLREDSQKDWSIFSPKKNPETAYQLGGILSDRSKDSRRTSYDLIMTTLKAAHVVLDDLQEDPDTTYGNQWIAEFCRNVTFKVDPEKSKERNEAFRALLLQMLDQPWFSQTAFDRLNSSSLELKLNGEELEKYANRAVAAQISQPAPELEKNDLPLIHYRLNMRVFHSSAFQFLLSRNIDSPEKIFARETGELLVKNRPLLHQSFQAALALKKASSAESVIVYQKFFDGLPEDPQAGKLAFAEWAGFIDALDIVPGDWANLHQAKILKNEDQGGALLSGWAPWVLRNQGREGFSRFVAALAEARFGDPGNWPVLAQLAPRNWPAEFQAAKLQFSDNVVKMTLKSSSLTEPLATEIRKLGLSEIVDMARKSYRQMWRQIPLSDSARFIKFWKTDGGLSLVKKGEAPKAVRVLTFLDALYSGWDWGKRTSSDLKSKLKADEEIDPFMKEILKFYFNFRVNSFDLLTDNLPTFEAMYQISPRQTGDFIVRLFPGFQSAGLEKESAAFLDRVAREMRAEIEPRLTKIVNSYGSVRDAFRQNEFWGEFAKVSSLDPDACALIFEQYAKKALSDFFSQRTNLLGTSISRGDYLSSLCGDLVKNRTNGQAKVSNLALVKIIHRLCRGELAEEMILSLTVRGSLQISFDDELMRRMSAEKDVSPLRKSLEALLPVLRALTPSERKTLIFLLPLHQERNWASSMTKGVPQDWEWLNGEIRKEFPDVADFFSAYVTRKPPGDRDKMGDYDRLAKLGASSLLRFLEREKLPAACKVRAAFVILNGARMTRHLVSSRHWNWLAEGMGVSLESSDSSLKDSGLKLLIHLKTEQFAGLSESPNHFLEMLVGSFSSGRFGEKHQEGFTRAVKQVAAIFLVSKRGDLLSKLIDNCPKVFERDLALHWQVFEAGEGKRLSGKFKLTSGLTDSSKLPRFGKDSAARIREFLKLFPIEDRYFLEVLFSTAPDLVGDDAPELSRLERMVPLARRFAEEGPEDPLFAHPLLSHFTTNPAAAHEVVEALREVEKNYLLGQLSQHGNENAHLRNIILAVLEGDLSEGLTDSALRQYRSFLGNDIGKSNNDEVKVVEAILFHVFAISVKEPKRAGEFVAFVNQLFQETLAVSGEDYLGMMMMVRFFAMMQYELANDAAGWEKLLAGLTATQQRNFDAVRKEFPIPGFLHLANFVRWKSSDTLKMRTSLERTLLTSKPFLAATREHPGFLLQAFAHGGFLDWKETCSLLETLPEPFFSEPIYQWMIVLGTASTDEYINRFSKVRELAKKGGFEKLEAEILLDHASWFFQNGRKVEALKMAEEIKPEFIEESHRQRTLEMIRKSVD